MPVSLKHNFLSNTMCTVIWFLLGFSSSAIKQVASAQTPKAVTFSRKSLIERYNIFEARSQVTSNTTIYDDSCTHTEQLQYKQ